jgi:hypothetical protein
MTDERRKPDNVSRFLAPAFAAVLGSAPGAYISIEMYSELAKQGAASEAMLIAHNDRMIRSERVDEIKADILKDHSTRIARLEAIQEYMQK